MEVPNTMHEPALAADFAQQVRPLIDLIDSLRNLGVDKLISLPRIAVVGDQSAGKSSVLEGVSGIELPRGVGIVTKCPLELRMKCDPKQFRCRVYAIDAAQDAEETANPAEVGALIKKVADPLVSNDEGFSDTTVIVELTSPSVPDLTLIDLPGIARVATQGQRSDLPEKIKSMIRRFVTDENTIILVVINGGNDIATTEGLKFAQEADPKGVRTVGVITKIDLVDVGAEGEIKKSLENEVFKLDLGYTAVKNRGQSQLDNLSPQQAREQEKEFFSTREPYRSMDPSLFGIPNLSKKLTKILVNRIMQLLPSIKSDIHQKLLKAQARLQQLGPELPEGRGRVAFLFGLVLGLSKQLALIVDGKRATHSFGENRMTGSLLNQIENISKRLQSDILSLAPDWSGKEFIQYVDRSIQNCTGKELSIMINPHVFGNLVADHVEKLRFPTEEAADATGDVIDRVFKDLIDSDLGRFPALQRACRIKLQDAVEKRVLQLKASIAEMVDIEREPFTLDPRFNRLYAEAIEQRQNGVGTPALSAEDRRSVMIDIMKCYVNVLHDTFTESVVKRIRSAAIKLVTAQAEEELNQIVAEPLERAEGFLDEAPDVLEERKRLTATVAILRDASRKIAEIA